MSAILQTMLLQFSYNCHVLLLEAPITELLPTTAELVSLILTLLVTILLPPTQLLPCGWHRWLFFLLHNNMFIFKHDFILCLSSHLNFFNFQTEISMKSQLNKIQSWLQIINHLLMYNLSNTLHLTLSMTREICWKPISLIWCNTFLYKKIRMKNLVQVFL